jgi:hypothetical protein
MLSLLNEQTRRKKLHISRKLSTMSNQKALDEITDDIGSVRPREGFPYDASTKEFMESRFGYDFNNVKVHTGELADRSANPINALAYSVGNDIVFAQGQYQPNTLQGTRLLAHELTHTIQLGYTYRKMSNESSSKYLYEKPQHSTKSNMKRNNTTKLQ